jgi:hypothetical protein
MCVIQVLSPTFADPKYLVSRQGLPMDLSLHSFPPRLSSRSICALQVNPLSIFSFTDRQLWCNTILAKKMCSLTLPIDRIVSTGKVSQSISRRSHSSKGSSPVVGSHQWGHTVVESFPSFRKLLSAGGHVFQIFAQTRGIGLH